MTKNETNGFRKALENKLLEIGDGSAGREALAIETSPDELDRIQNANDRDYAMSNLERKSSRLAEVRIALRRIAEGAFGICASCDEEINLKRLAAVPWTSFCIACQEAADHAQKSPQDETDTSLMAA